MEESQQNHIKHQFSDDEISPIPPDNSELWDVQLEVAKRLNSGNEQIIRQRVLKFFLYNYKHDLQEKFCERPDVNYRQSVQIYNNIIVVYGVDFLSTRKIYQYFKGIDIIRLTWMNDSTCKLQLKNSNDSQRAIKQHLLNIQQAKQIINPKKWYELIPYYQLTVKKSLFTRLGTNMDNSITKRDSQQYFAYKAAKKIFLQQMKCELQKQQDAKGFNLVRKVNRSKIQKEKYRGYNDPIEKRKKTLSEFKKVRLFNNEIKEEPIQVSSCSENEQKGMMAEQNLDLSLTSLYKQIREKKNKKIPHIYGQKDWHYPKIKTFNYKKYQMQRQQIQKNQKSKIPLIVIDQ